MKTINKFKLPDGKKYDLSVTWNNLQCVVKPVTIEASKWADGVYTIEDELATANSIQEIIPAAEITVAQKKAYDKAGLIQGTQKAGAFTIKALGKVPAVDIPVQVIFRGVE